MLKVTTIFNRNTDTNIKGVRIDDDNFKLVCISNKPGEEHECIKHWKLFKDANGEDTRVFDFNGVQVFGRVIDGLMKLSMRQEDAEKYYAPEPFVSAPVETEYAGTLDFVFPVYTKPVTA
jgi:hypothetical protein